MNDRWLYTIEVERTGEENMARDEQAAKACLHDGIPRIRFYTWTPWTLSLGYNQKTDKIDTEELARQGYGLVRRPTGGRAVFHAEELTYSIAMPGGGKGIHQTYAKISSGLKRGFESVGAEGIEFTRASHDLRDHYQTIDSEGCFSSSALNELAWNGRKIVGSAQRRYDSILLQHGSILLGDAHLEIVDFMMIDPERRPLLKERLHAKSVSLAEILTTPVPSIQKLSEAFLSGFAEEFQITPHYSPDLEMESRPVRSE